MKRGSIFELNGIPKFQEALPLALQHVVAMIVGCVTPAIIVAGAVGGNSLSAKDRVILIQASLVVSALSTLIQLFPIGKKNGFTLGSGLPMIMGGKFCLCTKYAGNCRRLWNQFDSWCADHRWHCCFCYGNPGKKNPGIFSTTDHRNSCLYHWTFPVSDSN